jgi:hypothetical protein
MGFAALTAIISGVMLLASPDGSLLQLPLGVLSGTPFNSFTIPGIILLFVVGGSNLAAMTAVMYRHKMGYSFSLTAGLLMIGWIITQMLMTSTSWWLQWVYLSIGMVVLLVSIQLKGKALI